MPFPAQSSGARPVLPASAGSLQLCDWQPGLRRCVDAALLASAAPAVAVLDAQQADWTSSGLAQLGAQLRPFACRIQGGTLRVDFVEGPCIAVALDGSRVDVLRGADGSALAIEALFGAGLVLACAARRRFALHASAVAHADRAYLLMGDSGLGKSTLAERIGRLPGWQRLSDDITPLRIDDRKIEVLPHFPQLKLDPPWPTPAVPAALQLVGVFQLARDAVAAVARQPMESEQRLPALLRHSAGTRLFPPEWLRAHLRAMSALAALVPVSRLRLPEAGHDLDALACSVAQLLLDTPA